MCCHYSLVSQIITVMSNNIIHTTIHTTNEYYYNTD